MKKKVPKVSLNEILKKQSRFGGSNFGKTTGQPKTFIPQTFRITQHKGGGGK